MLNTWISLTEVLNKTDGEKVNVWGCFTGQLMKFANTKQMLKSEFRICHKVSRFLVPELLRQYIAKNTNMCNKRLGFEPQQWLVFVPFSVCWEFSSPPCCGAHHPPTVPSLRKACSVFIVTSLSARWSEGRIPAGIKEFLFLKVSR